MILILVLLRRQVGWKCYQGLFVFWVVVVQWYFGESKEVELSFWKEEIKFFKSLGCFEFFRVSREIIQDQFLVGGYCVWSIDQFGFFFVGVSYVQLFGGGIILVLVFCRGVVF